MLLQFSIPLGIRKLNGPHLIWAFFCCCCFINFPISHLSFPPSEPPDPDGFITNCTFDRWNKHNLFLHTAGNILTPHIWLITPISTFTYLIHNELMRLGFYFCLFHNFPFSPFLGPCAFGSTQTARRYPHSHHQHARYYCGGGRRGECSMNFNE